MISWLSWFFLKRPLLKKLGYKRNPNDRRYWKGSVVISKDVNGCDVYHTPDHSGLWVQPWLYVRKHITHPAYHHFNYWDLPDARRAELLEEASGHG